MTNRFTPLFILLLLFTTKNVVFGQGVGKLRIYADFSEIVAQNTHLEISIINMSTNEEIIREDVNDLFVYSFPLEQRYLLYFKKEGFCTTRLLLDTHTFMSGIYTLKFGLDLMKKNEQNNSSIPIGVIKFNGATASFGYQPSELIATLPLKVSASSRQSEVVKF
jgi:hypothetical protein